MVRGERILSLPAKVLALFHGLFPGATAEMFGWVNRWVLPDGNGKQEARGMDVNEQARSKVLGALTSLGTSAAERFNQYPGPVQA